MLTLNCWIVPLLGIFVADLGLDPKAQSQGLAESEDTKLNS